MFYIAELTNQNKRFFEHLVPTKLRYLLHQDQEQTGGIVLGAGLEEKLVGVLLALPHPEDDTSHVIVYLFVTKRYRAIGIEHALLAEYEKRVRARGRTKLEMAPKVMMNTRQAYDLLTSLRENGWHEIRLLHTAFYLHDYSITRAKWFQVSVPEGYEIFYWRDLTAQDRNALYVQGSRLLQQNQEYLDPFVVTLFDDYTSLGLRRKTSGQVVGWMINEYISPTHVRFRRLFIIPEERSKGLFFPLLSNAITYAFKYYQHAVFHILADNRKMKSAVIKMMGHLCDYILECYYCKKELQPESAN